MAAESKLPYVGAYGRISSALEKIQTASTPDRFTQDFLATRLGLKGGSAKPLIPFLKRTGFLASDGSPTHLYKRFRNDPQRGAAAAEAMRIGFARLYEYNEFIHDVAEPELRGFIVQATGLERNSSTVRAIVGSFKALRAFADFEDQTEVIETATPEADAHSEQAKPSGSSVLLPGLNFGYTVNLHLPPSSDPAVFSAIFRSLREHLLVESNA